MSDVFSGFFVDPVHEENFNSCCKALNINAKGDRDCFLLLFLLSAISDGENIGQIVTKEYGNLRIRPSVIHEGWVTGGSARILRLAFHLFNYGCPTAYDLPVEEELAETRKYLPMEVLTGLDSRLSKVALNALAILVSWS